MCKISNRQWRNKPRWFWAGFHKYLCLPQMEGVFLYCVCQSECKYCGMCSHSWSIDSTTFLVTSACQETRLLPFIGCSTAAICGQRKKLLLSSESLWYAWGAVSCGLLNMITWIDVISYFLKPAEWCGEMKPARSLGQKRLCEQKLLGLESVQLCSCGVLRVKSVGHRKCGGDWTEMTSILGCRWVSVGAMAAPEHPSSLPFIWWVLGKLFWPCI